MLYFSGEHQFFQRSIGIKFLYDQGRKLFHFLAGETYFGTGDALFAKLSTGESYWGASHRGTWIGCSEYFFFKSSSQWFILRLEEFTLH